MKNTVIFILLTLNFIPLSAQKNGIYINFGLRKMNTTQQSTWLSPMVSYYGKYSERKQSTTNGIMRSISFGYTRQLTKRFSLSLAANMNEKGVAESHVYTSSGIVTNNNYDVKDLYVGIQLGGQYEILKKPFGNLAITAQINPEFKDFVPSHEYLYWCGSAGLVSDIHIKGQLYLPISFTYEQGFMEYRMTHFGFPTYIRPYGFGLNLGLRRLF